MVIKGTRCWRVGGTFGLYIFILFIESLSGNYLKLIFDRYFILNKDFCLLSTTSDDLSAEEDEINDDSFYSLIDVDEPAEPPRNAGVV